MTGSVELLAWIVTAVGSGDVDPSTLPEVVMLLEDPALVAEWADSKPLVDRCLRRDVTLVGGAWVFEEASC